MQTLHKATLHDTAMHDTVDDDAPVVVWFDRLIEWLNGASLYIAMLIAWSALSGSLVLSEIREFPPCELCWYQRALMYPLALILPIGILRRARRLPLYVLPLSLVGSGVALYHYLLTKTNLFPPPACNVEIPCTQEYLNLIGFINIPFMSLIAFLAISIVVIGSALSWDEEDDPPPAGWRRRALLAIIAVIAVAVGGSLFLGIIPAIG